MCNCVFIVLTETWLNDSFLSNELGLFNYNIYRYDRPSLNSSFNRGGGVLIAIRKNFHSFLVPSPDISIEQLFVHLYIYFVLSAVYIYIPPSSQPDVYETHATSIDIIIQKFSLHFHFLWRL